uniref:DNA-directed RNA polymerase subunit n=1 Tax=Phallusia mammillata TaxID=59560 RepID=A0A6F9DP95_9ASCI|nr:DNA-directed RNA polymerase I subunit RPA1-like [Phallusia mammillata]
MIRHMGVTNKSISALRFTCFNSDEIRNLSVKHVVNPHSLDAALNPMEGGLYDPVFGAMKDDVCATCGQGSVQCPGHMGHIDLPLPVYHPLFFKTLKYLLRGSCMQCKRLLVPRQKLLLLAFQLEAIKNGLVQTVFALKEAENEIKGLSGDSNDAIANTEMQDHLREILVAHNEKVRQANQGVQDMEVTARNAESLHLELIAEFLRLLAKNVNRCPHCGAGVMPIRTEHCSRVFVLEGPDKTGNESSQTYVTPSDVKQHIMKLWENEKTLLSRIFVAMADAAGEGKPDEADKISPTKAVDVLFLSVLPVPPSRFRPMGMINDKSFESPQSTAYSKVLKDCVILRILVRKLGRGEKDITFEEAEEDVTKMGVNKIKLAEKSTNLLSAIPGKTLGEKMENAWHRLQQHVNMLFDSDLDRLTPANAGKTPGIKQLLEKKDGLFRKHMMGKRVNYAARSVISPDPYIATNEIGLPLTFATRLTYPTPVTPWNVQMLRKAVINGPKVHPGATHVVCGERTMMLSATNPSQREAIARKLLATDKVNVDDPFEKSKVVMRHIQTGDVMLVNRQPTLHKGSMMAHKVRVLPGEKTLRLHYANCKSYNADFDGDEMNAHFPQTQPGRSEAYQLMITDQQYLSGKDGKPLSCLIQDHMVAGVSLCMRGRFFTREAYQQLLYNSLLHLPYKIKYMKPSILKPQVMWSGKQLISSVLMNIIPEGLPFINFQGKSKISSKDWKKWDERPPAIGTNGGEAMSESQVVIMGAELLCGVLDKAHYGATEYGLVHAVYELYGGKTSGSLLTCLSRLFTAFLQQYKGFTLGVEDILVIPSADKERRDVIERTKNDGLKAVAKTLNVKNKRSEEEVTDALWDAHVTAKNPTKKGEDKLAAVDHAMKSVSNAVNDRIASWCTGNGLLKTFPKNNLQLMVTSGAKGGAVNCMQISCLLGQIELEGRRPPLMPSGRSLPSFKPYDTTLRAGGFISQRFLTGIRPQEYFFHCMAGREGLVDTAVKTSRSGYLQRCLIKHLEGLVLSYDMTIRDSDGSVIQFLYGEDGIDVAKSSYLQQKQCDFVVKNLEAIERQLPSLETISAATDTTTAARKFKKFLKARKKRNKKLRKCGGVIPRSSGFLSFIKQCDIPDDKTSKITLCDMWRELPAEERQKFIKKSSSRLPDPVASAYQPDRYLGSISERFFDETREYLNRNPLGLPKTEQRKTKLPSLERLESLLKIRYQRSLCHPGEGAGLLAAQSIGEPSTQMTLNTFHFAGRGEMNVTLGIPRLREILLVASKQIKTPQMTVPVYEGREKRARKLCKRLTRVMLSQVLHKANLAETLVVEETRRNRRFVIEMELLPETQLAKEHALSRDHVLRHIEKKFFRAFFFALNKRLAQADDVMFVEQRKSVNRTGTEEGSEDQEDVPVNDDADGDEVTKSDDVDYEDQDNVSEEPETNGMDETMDIEENSLPGLQNSGEGNEEPGDDEDMAPISAVEEANASVRIKAVKNMGMGQVDVEDYQYDIRNNSWCKVTLLMPLTSVHIDLVSLMRDQAAETPVRKVKGISRCILVPVRNKILADEGRVNFTAEGVNFFKMFENDDILDVSSIYCNCIHSVAGMYGIEAARTVIVKEIAGVFAAYGIEVDPRHLSLVADYMCFEGTYKPFNRLAIESCASPLQQMSFESTMKFLNNAALFGLTDHLQSPSARIVTGQVVKGGTGSFTLHYPLAKYL